MMMPPPAMPPPAMPPPAMPPPAMPPGMPPPATAGQPLPFNGKPAPPFFFDVTRDGEMLGRLDLSGAADNQSGIVAYRLAQVVIPAGEAPPPVPTADDGACVHNERRHLVDAWRQHDLHRQASDV